MYSIIAHAKCKHIPKHTLPHECIHKLHQIKLTWQRTGSPMLLNKMIIVLTIGSGSVVQYPLNMFLAVQELILQRRASVLCVVCCVHLCCCSSQDFPRGGCGSHQDKETKPQEQCCTNAITKTYSRI